MLKLTDLDESTLELREVIEGDTEPDRMLLLNVTDENEIPIGMYLQTANARLLRDTLTNWLSE